MEHKRNKFIGGVLTIAMICLLIYPQKATPSNSIPLKLQAPILLKILAYDRNLKQRTTNSGKAIIFGILCNDKEIQEKTKRTFSTYEGKTLQMIPLQIEPITCTDASNFETIMKTKRYAAIYIAEDIKENFLEQIKIHAQKYKVPLFSGDQKFINHGAAVALKLSNNKLKIVIHINNAKSQGLDLPAKLMQLAEIIQ